MKVKNLVENNLFVHRQKAGAKNGYPPRINWICDTYRDRLVARVQNLFIFLPFCVLRRFKEKIYIKLAIK